MRIGQTYSLQCDVFLWDVNWNRFFLDHYGGCIPALWLVAPEQETGWWKQDTPLPSTDEYRRTHEPGGIKGIVSRGTTLSLTKIDYYTYVEDATSYYLFTVADGPYRGKLVCANELMLPHKFPELRRQLDPTYLQPVP
jgi:hypothetical protein